MPTTKSAEKRLKQSELQRTRNRSVKRDVRTRCKKVIAALAAGNREEAQTAFREAAKKVDQAAAKKVLHRNAAARLKSRIAAKMKQAGAKA
jgi:small subunit ribosomal protein S20